MLVISSMYIVSKQARRISLRCACFGCLVFLAQIKKKKTIHGNKQVNSVITEAAWATTRTKNTFYSARYYSLQQEEEKNLYSSSTFDFGICLPRVKRSRRV